ncbi:MAG: bifunctional (p)ppGpp synthetase/guanosine-3',5'-bis(diphosphate) 3'-pyrophosphohydrolase [Candidatus Magasanikbacteria bacterium]|jgi:GTP diphosphokinase / guanosine-3',5'-bis(diphosphate) 3'-diphosphatase|nr:bifunctional (p)ppGpp synthetase/guanosine-3',5'-bis(diphosphate) 3'-pyrophosphohydrolase [Candidatus Magasanikbacteria bacterium]MBT4221525.1 bifunctional (p)ppGpp synthetase/guanosine-3',5'-bis(diphosphate) 3'-pyrophosphohydrolase [Candidatus Magasanikbacteria bacterium]MBT4350476.1 bifunctional (p)ppGpp synthetase/guanosine-3',5'-bis(diphosphate) 3'-pyrophosphohydrolase [Candidatus Magasanikbacteria bacterium]MBT4541874.1 bifunctional (p)ppGpp synthetase/guanosine-3',5'-bis(diphosphate) 3'
MAKTLTIEGLVEKILGYAPDSDTEIVRLAYEFAKDAHEGQTRRSGEPYITHPLAAAHILADIRIDPVIVTATLLHDVPEDTEVTLEDIEKNFGSDIASLVRGITKLGKLKYRGVERYIENLRKMFVAMAEDARVMLIKFADRVHNLTTLGSLPPQKQYRIALESLEIYAPIAGRLGIAEMKGQLEDLSFRYVYPKEYARVKNIRTEKLQGKEGYIDTVRTHAKEEIASAGVTICSIEGREKRLFSFYQKLIRKDNKMARIYDLVAIRIIVPSVADCYAVLGVLHKVWKPVKGRIKDYISQPKPNGYQSLHTTVFSENGELVEFQIRTEEMHEEAEFGIAAHWHYDEKGGRLPKKQIQWAKELAEIQKDILNNLTDLESMKVDFLQNRIFVFTPKGDVIDLPDGATPVDFAYHIHTEIGNKCGSAIVNDNIAKLDAALKNGDVVEIIMDKGRKGPNPDWLSFVKTHTAKSHIKLSAKNKKLTGWLKSVLPKK